MPARSPQPIDDLVPEVDGAKLVKRLAKTDSQTIVAWCIDEQDAIDRIKSALARAGWTDIRTRGAITRAAGVQPRSGERIGIAAKRGEARFSATAGGHDDRCAGTFVSATVMRVGALEIPPGEKLR